VCVQTSYEAAHIARWVGGLEKGLFVHTVCVPPFVHTVCVLPFVHTVCVLPFVHTVCVPPFVNTVCVGVWPLLTPHPPPPDSSP